LQNYLLSLEEEAERSTELTSLSKEIKQRIKCACDLERMTALYRDCLSKNRPSDANASHIPYFELEEVIHKKACARLVRDRYCTSFSGSNPINDDKTAFLSKMKSFAETDTNSLEIACLQLLLPPAPPSEHNILVSIEDDEYNQLILRLVIEEIDKEQLFSLPTDLVMELSNHYFLFFTSYLLYLTERVNTVSMDFISMVTSGQEEGDEWCVKQQAIANETQTIAECFKRIMANNQMMKGLATLSITACIKKIECNAEATFLPLLTAFMRPLVSLATT